MCARVQFCSNAKRFVLRGRSKKMWAGAFNYRRLRQAAFMLCFVGILSYIIVPRYRNWVQLTTDSMMVMAWSGFGPEKGLYNFTVVTAMLDIGRGSWSTQTRAYNTYLLYMQRVLRLDVNMVIFVDSKGKPFIDWMRRGRENHTHIIITDLKDLPYYTLRGRIAEIMDSEEYRRDNELVAKHLCESYSPEYDILQLSKLYLLDRTVRENPFHTTYFMWMDAGYGRGEDIHPPDGVWIPKGLFEHSDQVTFLEREPGVKAFVEVKDSIHKMSINIVPGGFFGGGGKALQELYQMQQDLMEEWMRDGVIDDDQTAYMLMYYKKPSLFHLVSGDWYDAFALFNAHAHQFN